LLLISALFIAGIAQSSPTDWEGTRPIVPASEAPAPIDLSGPPPNPSPRFLLQGTTVGPEQGSWMRIAPPLGVGSLGPSVIYDPGGNRLIVYGGIGIGPSYQNAVAAFQLPGGTWTTLATSGTPPPGRRLQSAVYDPVGNRMIVFGGVSDTLLDDVWQLTLGGTPTWSQIDAGPGPSPRAGCGAIYDAAGQRMIVFGGAYAGDEWQIELSDEVWALSLSGSPQWSQLSPATAAPTARFAPSAVYDPAGPALVLHGGTDLNTLNTDTWRLSLDATPTWSQLNPIGAPPPGRIEQASSFDPATRRMFVFGGYSFSDVLDDLWFLDLSVNPPVWNIAHPAPSIPGRWGTGAAVANGRLYLYGGADLYSRILADVWSVSASSPVSWTTFELLMPKRLQEAMVLDTQRDRLVSFGGTDGAYRNDVWTHSMVSGRGWDPMIVDGPVPPARRLHTGIYDPIGDRLIVFGGYDDHVLGDLWQLSFSGTPAWSPLTATGGGPSPRAGHLAIYDPVGERMVVFGGWDGVSPPANRIGDTWELSLSGSPHWTQLDTGPGPSARSSGSATYDPIHHAMVVFGGTDPSFRNDTWRLNLDGAPQWTLVSTGNPMPGSREENGLVHDSQRDRLVMFGGYDQNIQNYGDLWAQGGSPASWSLLAPDGIAPSARWGMKTIYDPTRDGMWLYGGWSDTYQQDLWFLQWYTPASLTIASQSATTGGGAAHLVWSTSARYRNATRVERSADGVNWTLVGATLPTANGTMRFTDTGVAAGQTRAWRVRSTIAGTTMTSAPVWLTMSGPLGVIEPPPLLSIRAVTSRPGTIGVAFTMPHAGHARVELLDVAGRQVDRLDLGTVPIGERRVELGTGLPPGLYFARLVADAGVVSTKATTLR
jgi:hypothetical protein